MRIDDLNSAAGAHAPAKTDAIGTDRTKPGGSPMSDADPDSANISSLAANALNAAETQTSAGSNDARLDALRLQVERGEYKVSAQDVAARIIDQHIVR